MMMSFCKKSVHSFLALSNPLLNIDTTTQDQKPPPRSQPGANSNSFPPSGLGLITGETLKTPNVLESATVKKRELASSPSQQQQLSSPLLSSSSSSSSSLSSSSPLQSSMLSLLSPLSVSSPNPAPGKKDPGGIGFIDDIGGGVDGLMSCTESIGFESSDERRVDDEIELCCSDTRSMREVKWRKVGERREVKKFPPPLSSFNHNGQPSFFLRPVRKDGRLELTEVRIDWPEILRASREDGRLRLHLIRDEGEEEAEEQDDDFSILEEENQEQEQGQVEDEEIDPANGVERLEEVQETREEWRSVSSENSDQSFRRCHDDVVMAAAAAHHRDYHHHHHHHHNDHLHVWSPQCVTTR